MKQYIGTKIIQAEPMMRGDDPGYFVRYSDGYSSWSPKKVFDDAYRPADAMSFGLAIEALKKGHKVSRAGWNGKGMYLLLQMPDAHSKMTMPYIYMKTAEHKYVPWLASQNDMLCDDWVLFDSSSFS